ncbi:unannotated protein [freshwater metagenome]|uniref:Unannotated protein n=1 Tax=freshwater metagenome TaxID=449393 RepID=A0A6J6AH06_9ZZZZ
MRAVASPAEVPSGVPGKGRATPFGIPVVPLEYNMSVPSTMSDSGTEEAESTVDSNES